MSGQVVLDEVDGDALGGKDTAKGFVALQLGGRTDARHHGCGHIAEQKHHIFLLGCQMLCDFHRCHSLAAAGASPDGQNTTAGSLDDFSILQIGVAVEQASFHEIHPTLASLSAAGSAPSLSSVSVPSAFSAPSSTSGSAYSFLIRASCASMNLAAFSGVPR